MPWDNLYQRGWRIVGLNHYGLHGKAHLFCSMALHGRSIKAEGEDEEGVFRELEKLAEDDHPLQHYVMTAEEKLDEHMIQAIQRGAEFAAEIGAKSISHPVDITATGKPFYTRGQTFTNKAEAIGHIAAKMLSTGGKAYIFAVWPDDGKFRVIFAVTRQWQEA